ARLCMTVVSLPHFCDALAFSFFFYFYVPHRALLSFPTRRSSDLGGSSMISRPAFQVFGRNDCFWWMFFLLASLKPAAMTVIFTESFMLSSCTAPKMMLAFSWAAFWMTLEAS